MTPGRHHIGNRKSLACRVFIAWLVLPTFGAVFGIGAVALADDLDLSQSGAACGEYFSPDPGTPLSLEEAKALAEADENIHLEITEEPEIGLTIISVGKSSGGEGPRDGPRDFVTCKLGTGYDGSWYITGERYVFGQNTPIHFGGEYVNLYSGLWVGDGWYRPDGSLYWEDRHHDWIPDPPSGQYWTWYNIIYSYDPMPTSMQSVEGNWQAKWWSSDSNVCTKTYTVMYDLVDHKTCGGLSGDEPTDIRTNFYVNDDNVYSWLRMDNFALNNSDDIKWEWIRPNGTIYWTHTEDCTNPGAGSWYGWYKTWCYMSIDGHEPGWTPGSWQVKVYIKDYSGTYEHKFTEYFTISCVTSGPNITQHPASQDVCEGASVTFTVSATGVGTLSYQWRKNGSNIGGATGSSYTINPVGAGNAGSYDCRVTDVCGSTTSNSATLTVRTAPTITSHPASQSVCEGGSATFTVGASGTGTLTYQWRKNGLNISGATGSSHTIDPVGTGDAGTYDVVVSNDCGSVTSNPATLTVDTAPTITSHPSDQTVCEGDPVTFSVTASGTAPLSYQWRKNGGSIPGATGSSYTIDPVSMADVGSYDVEVTNVCGSVISNAATLTVDTAPTITSHPSDQTVCEGDPVTFSVTASGTAPLSYQWRKGGGDIPGATGSSYTIDPVGLGDVGIYDVVVTNVCGLVTSNTATLTVDTAPAITSHPADQTVCEGEAATFTVTATGTPPLSYQWRKGGGDIPGATGSFYTIDPVGTADAGSYDVVVTNICGSVTSNAATLAVDTAPTITQHPADQDACEGGSVTFNITATGTTPLSYQWRRNGVMIPGATGSSYTINNVTPGQAGSYDVRVSNPCGLVTSNAATLTVFATDAADVNDDGTVNGEDIAAFLDVLFNNPGGPPSEAFCAADMDGSGQVDLADVQPFVDALLGS